MRRYEQVRASWRVWQSLGVSTRVLNWIKYGVPTNFVGGLPPPPFNFGNSVFHDPAQYAAWIAIRDQYLASGGLQLVHPCNTHKLRHIYRAFMVPKPGPVKGKFRLVVDGRPGNDFYIKHTTTYESLSKLPLVLVKNDWTVAFDVSDAYHHLAIRESDRDFMAICVHGEFFRFPSLPFGWCNSPYFFTEFIAEFNCILRSGSGTRIPRLPNSLAPVTLRTLAFLDDFLVMFRRKKQAEFIALYIVQLALKLGISLHPTKTDWQPKQTRQHLGMLIDTVHGEFRVPASKLARIKGLAKDILCHAGRNQRYVSQKSLKSFAGLGVSLYIALPRARMYLRSIYDVLRTCSGVQHVKLSHQSIRDLNWWLQLSSEWNGKAIWRHPDHIVAACDASSFAWGAVVLSGVSAPVGHARGFFSKPLRLLGSTHRELLGARFAVQAYLTLFRGRHVVLLEDNTGVEHLLRHFSSRVPALQAELRRFSAILYEHDITLETVRVSSEDNPADAPSRYVSLSSVVVQDWAFRRVHALHGPHTIDRFASWDTSRCELFNCGHGDARAVAVDCFSQSDWMTNNNYCQPPVRLIPELVHFLLAHPCDATLCVPVSPSALWWPLVQQFSSSTVVVQGGLSTLTRSRSSRVLSSAPCDLLIARFTSASLTAWPTLSKLWRPGLPHVRCQGRIAPP